MRTRRITVSFLLTVATAVGTLLGVAGQAAPAAAATKSTVVIGDLCSCTGPEASTISQTTATMQAWASWVSSHGGLAGHPVKLVVQDDNYSPVQAIAAANTLIDTDHVIAIFDNSDEDPSWGPVAQKADVPVLGGQETDSGWQNADFYPAGASFNYTNPVGAIVAKKAGVKKEAVLYCVEVAICAESTKQGETVAAHYGINYVYTEGIGFAAPNYSAECLAAKQAGATAMTVGDASSVVDKVVENCAAQGYSPLELSSDGTVAIAWLDIPGMNGNIDTQSDLPWFVHNSATKDMYAALAKYAKGVTTGQNFGEVVLQSWSDGALLQAAVATAKPSGALTSAVIKKGLYALPSGETLGGLAPPLHFVKGKPANNSCFFVMGIKNKKFVELNGGKTICAPLVKAGTLPTS